MPAIRPRLKLRGCGPHEQALRTAAAPGPGRTKHDALRAAVVAAGERAEALLAGGVPDGQLQALAAHRDKLQPEVDTCTPAPGWLAQPRPLGLRSAAWKPYSSLALASEHIFPQTYRPGAGTCCFQVSWQTRQCRAAPPPGGARCKVRGGRCQCRAPIVGALESSNWSAVKRISSEDLPTPESPTSRICRRTALSAPSAAETSSCAGQCAAVTQYAAPVKIRRL